MSNAAMETFLHSPHWRFLTAQSPNRLAKLPNTNHISRMKMCMSGIQQNTVLTQDAAKRQSFSPNPQKSSCFAYLLQKIVSNLLTQKAIISLQLGSSWWQRPSVPRGIHEEGPFVRAYYDWGEKVIIRCLSCRLPVHMTAHHSAVQPHLSPRSAWVLTGVFQGVREDCHLQMSWHELYSTVFRGENKP